MSAEKKGKRKSVTDKTIPPLMKGNVSKHRVKSPAASIKKSDNMKVSPSDADNQLHISNDIVLKLKKSVQVVRSKKSGIRMKKNVESSRTVTPHLKKHKSKDKDTCKEKETEQEQEHEQILVQDKNSLLELALAQKRSSVFHREVRAFSGRHHVKMAVPVPIYHTVSVKKHVLKAEKLQTYGVLKPAHPLTQFKELHYCWPRVDASGQIVPHSILGEVKDFLREAERRNQFKEIRESHSVLQSEVLPRYRRKPLRVPKNPKLNEKKALQTWDVEMKTRRQEMKRLAGILGRPEKQLLMSSSDNYVTIAKGRRLLAPCLENVRPDLCFWKLQSALGHRQIWTTLTKLERGIIPTPELNGDSATIKMQKGSLRKPFENSWYNMLRQTDCDEQAGGIIKIYNKMLFDDLEVCGKTLVKQQKSFDEPDHCIPDGDASSHLIPDGDASSHLTNVNTLLQIKNKTEFTGPCLKIGGTLLKWVKGCCQSNRIIKTKYILIDGFVDELASSCIDLQNCGTTIIKYKLKKCVEVKPIPICRPCRPATFYIRYMEGVILPGDTEMIDVNFRSRVPGIFSESWLLETDPILAGGGQTKLILKGWARLKNDLSKECLLLKEMIEKRETISLCSFLAKEIVEFSILKAYLKSHQLQEEEYGTEEVSFATENSGLFHHDHIVKKLEKLYRSLTLEVQGFSPATDGALSLTKLTKLIHSLPDTEMTEKDSSVDNNDMEENKAGKLLDRKEMLLWQLYCDVSVLSFSPITFWLPPPHMRYMICYRLMADGISRVVALATRTAEYLGLEVIRNDEHDPVEPEDEVREKRKGCQDSVTLRAKPSNHKDNKDIEVEMQEVKSQRCFSTVYVFRMRNTGYVPALSMYDEKVYTMMHNMLIDAVSIMGEMFKDL